MKLYLSSWPMGDHGNVLLDMVGGRGARMAVVTNALDHIRLDQDPAPGHTKLDPVAYFAEYGFDPWALDLRAYFGRTADLLKVILHHQVIWAVGGNAFLLRRAMRLSGFDALLGDLIEQDIVYAGWSAGACVAGRSLRPITLIDEPTVCAPGYGASEPILDGLGVFPGTIIPHYDSDHPESEAAWRAAQWATEHNIEHVTLRDGEVLVQNDGPPVILARRT